MKKVLGCLSMAALAVVMAAPVSAQTLSVTASVPFDFVVGGRTMPAGDYVVNTITTFGVLEVQDASQAAAPVLTRADSADGPGNGDGAHLTFRRYGGDYFLVNVWAGPGSEALDSDVQQREGKSQECIARQARGGDGSGPPLTSGLVRDRFWRPWAFRAALHFRHGRSRGLAAGAPFLATSDDEAPCRPALRNRHRLYRLCATRSLLPGDADRGKDVFRTQDCVVCHSINGEAERAHRTWGRALIGLQSLRPGGLLWNHAPLMWAPWKVRELPARVERAAGRDLFVYFFAARYSSSPATPGAASGFF